MDSVWEVLANGSLANSGSQKHGFNNFAKATFSTSNFESVYYGGSKGPAAQQFNLTASIRQDADTTLSAAASGGRGARLVWPAITRVRPAKTQLIFFTESGSFANEGEVLEVEAGSSKVSLVLQNWDFCTANESGPPCFSMEGEWVDATFSIMVRAAAHPRARRLA